MGLLQEVAGHPLAEQFRLFGLGSQIAIVLGSIVTLSVILNVASQLLFKNPNEPPMVFHWFPLIGSTITYGMDPPTFFKENRAKVSRRHFPPLDRSDSSADFGLHSSETSSPLSFWERRPPSPWGQRATISSSTASSRTSMPRRSTLS